MEISLASADAVVLSHGHYDHTGGLAQVLKAVPRSGVFVHPAAFDAKHMRDDDGTVENVGMPLPDRNIALERPEEPVWTSRPTEIRDGVFVTGEIPRATDFEDTGGPFFLDEQCRQPDPLIDDQAVFFDATAGTVVLLGCAHSGVINTLRYVRQLTDDRPIHAVVGGMHLMDASSERIDRTVEALKELCVACLVPVHCTGAAASARLCSEFPGQCLSCNVGETIEFEI